MYENLNYSLLFASYLNFNISTFLAFIYFKNYGIF